MDNEKWTHEVKNNDLADGLEDCKIFENTLDNNLDKKTEENKNEKDYLERGKKLNEERIKYK